MRSIVQVYPGPPILCGAVAQLGERLVCNQEATGSIPVSSTRFLSWEGFQLNLSDALMPTFFIVLGLGFLFKAWTGKDGDFRWGRTGKGPVMSTKLGKAVCLVFGSGFFLGGLIIGAFEVLSHSR